MKKFVFSIIFIFAVALIFVACGSTDKKEKGDTFSKSEEAETREVKSDVNKAKDDSDGADEEKGGDVTSNIPQWVTDGGESVSSSEKICAVGVGRRSMDLMMSMMFVRDRALAELAKKLGDGVVKQVKQEDSYMSSEGMIYILVCADRESNKQEETDNKDEEKTDK